MNVDDLRTVIRPCRQHVLVARAIVGQVGFAGSVRPAREDVFIIPEYERSREFDNGATSDSRPVITKIPTQLSVFLCPVTAGTVRVAAWNHKPGNRSGNQSGALPNGAARRGLHRLLEPYANRRGNSGEKAAVDMGNADQGDRGTVR